MAAFGTPADPELEADFRAARRARLAELNASPFHLGMAASLVMAFSLWDWFVDPAAWSRAFVVRLTAAALILTTGVVQKVTRTVDWAPLISKVRFSCSIMAVAGANAIVRDGFLVGLAGLVAAFQGGPYIVLDRRDYFATLLPPLAGVALVMYVAGVDRFTATNGWVFIALTVTVGLMLSRVFEATNRRAFMLEQALKREARTDALTGLPNRRAMEEFILIELKRQSRLGRPTALVVCDIDHFKYVNDERGHDVGDRTIRAVGERLRSLVRGGDRVGRWGGEEFLLILPETSSADAAALAERMRLAVEVATGFTDNAARVTISLGVAAASARADEPTTLAFDRALKMADRALYQAKATGRNRIVTADTVRI
jgi:diguanylate cyclase (GGDEF)-like protein